MSGLSNSFPFQYQGLEHEITDPGNLYFDPSGNVYNPQIQRGLSQAGQQGWGAPANGGFGPGHHAARGRGGGNGVEQALNDEATVFEAASLASPAGWLPLTLFGSEWSMPLPIPIVPSVFQSIWDFFFGGGGNSTPPKPYQMRYHRHPIYDTLGIALDLTLTQASAAPQASGGGSSGEEWSNPGGIQSIAFIAPFKTLPQNLGLPRMRGHSG